MWIWIQWCIGTMYAMCHNTREDQYYYEPIWYQCCCSDFLHFGSRLIISSYLDPSSFAGGWILQTARKFAEFTLLGWMVNSARICRMHPSHHTMIPLRFVYDIDPNRVSLTQCCVSNAVNKLLYFQQAGRLVQTAWVYAISFATTCFKTCKLYIFMPGNSHKTWHYSSYMTQILRRQFANADGICNLNAQCTKSTAVFEKSPPT